MQPEHTGCVPVAGDESRDGKLFGIFTQCHTLLRIVDRGKKPATLPVGEAA